MRADFVSVVGFMRSLWLAIVALAVVTVGCSERPVGAVVADTSRTLWRAGEGIELRYENHDTLAHYDLSVVVRREASRAEGAMPLMVRCTSPSGVSFESFVVVTPVERHAGGSFEEPSVLWVTDAQLHEEGDYLFTITPTSDLRGVWSVGVELKVGRKASLV